MDTAIDIDIDLTFDDLTHELFFCPDERAIREWIQCTLQHTNRHGVLSLKVVNAHDMAQLNNQYRKKNKPTNVLSFPCQLPSAIRGNILGDIVICPSVLAQEAQTQNKTALAHWAHIVVHGVLHLLGYDHEHDDDANVMENLEISILADLGFNDPYGVEKIDE